MSDFREPVPNANSDPEEIGAKEATLNSVVQALQIALGRSRGAALINMGETPVSQQEAADRLPDNFHHITIEDIIARRAALPRDKNGLVVTGYSRNLYPDREKERAVQTFIRAQANMRGLNEGKFLVLVLSDSLPSEEFLHDASLPWWNGPFQGDDSVWSIRSSEVGITLVRHDRSTETVREPSLRRVTTWVEKQTFLLGK